MSKVIKPGRIGISDEAVMIPDVRKPAVHAPMSLQEEEIVNSAAAQELYDNMIAKARADADHLSDRIKQMAQAERESILRQAAQDAENLKKQAYEDSFMAAVTQKSEELEKCIEDTRSTLEALREEHRKFMEQYAEELHDFALDIASEILQKRIANVETDLFELIEHAVNSVKDVSWISVEISKQLPQLINLVERSLKDRKDRTVEIVPRDLPPDACILKTSDGNVDASISTQIANLREYFNQAQ